jgi:hypothetical protein
MNRNGNKLVGGIRRGKIMEMNFIHNLNAPGEERMSEMDGNNMFSSDDEMMIMIERMQASFSEFQYSDLYSKAISSEQDFKLCKH